MLFSYVQQFHNKNQFVIYGHKTATFQSYESTICLFDEENEITLYKDWDYSNTTRKHLYMFLEEICGFTLPTKNKRLYLLKKIKDGTIIKGY